MPIILHHAWFRLAMLLRALLLALAAVAPAAATGDLRGKRLAGGAGCAAPGTGRDPTRRARAPPPLASCANG